MVKSVSGEVRFLIQKGVNPTGNITCEGCSAFYWIMPREKETHTQKKKKLR